ncbi:hypothetical protein, partial [Prevotella sp.]|uniref:hypothetical protein n=1 Tax=Prevotella sp. TaxID=59823 RepID=UPI0025E8C4E4
MQCGRVGGCLLLLEVFKVKRLWRPFFYALTRVHDLFTLKQEEHVLYFSWVFIFFVKACVFLSISLLYFKK